MDIVEHGVDTIELFAIEKNLTTGRYYAVRTGKGKFVMEGATIADVAEAARQALTFLEENQ